MTPLRWIIVLLGPLPICASSWLVSAWFEPAPAVPVARNDVFSLHAARGTQRNDLTETPPVANAHELAKACDIVAARLQSELGPECHSIVRAPFVLAGDISAPELAAQYARGVEPAARAMWRCYFDTVPNGPITLLLFQNERSYNEYAHRLFGDNGISIYGYYKPGVRTLILNLATGEGTLLHELTHALMDFDFPHAPIWLNEGLASLHEQCRYRNDSEGPWIEGLANWRLAGLKQVIGEGKLQSLVSLLTHPDFRGPADGTNYAQARYFCLYLQQKQLLADFYRTFRADNATDPRGLGAIKRLFPEYGWPELDEDFQRWVMALAD